MNVAYPKKFQSFEILVCLLLDFLKNKTCIVRPRFVYTYNYLTVFPRSEKISLSQSLSQLKKYIDILSLIQCQLVFYNIRINMCFSFCILLTLGVFYYTVCYVKIKMLKCLRKVKLPFC